jgi:hypothetical protein
VLQNVTTTCHSISAAHCCDVITTVIEPIYWSAKVKNARIKTVLESSHTVSHTSSKVSNCAGMTDGCADSPAAISTFDIGKSTGLNCMPLINTARSFASHRAAAETGENFVDCIHIFK